ncbi:MAG: hypothetical protein ACT4OI_03305 [Methanobacteriota archaeon]
MAAGPSQADFLIALVLGIGPALGVLYWSLRRFDRPHVDHALFDDRRVFGALAVGMVFGMFASALNLLLSPGSLAGAVLVLASVLLLEELFKLVYLNRRRYRGRFDTTFYGVPLGVGGASTSVVANIVWATAAFPVPLASIALFVVFSAGLSLANASSGALVGFGASRGAMVRPLLQAVGVRYAHAALLMPFYLQADPWGIVSLITAFGFVLIVFRYVYDEVLPGTLPEDLRRQLRRSRRRAQAVKD